MSWRSVAPTALFAAVAVAPSCAKAPADSSAVPSTDLSPVSGSFSAGEIVALAPFTDDQTLASSDVQQFLEKTPYGGQASFLSTYSSHGIRADDAVVAAAHEYALNPLVFLVAAEAAQGLLDLSAYPSSPSRVEYVFGCGCATASGDCDPSLAGFDVQVDCLGSALRESLDAVAATGHTDGGWGPGIAKTTLDGISVTPADASTAALYQYTPAVEPKQTGGNWIFWNIWQRYAAALGYKGPTGSQPTASIGDACTSSGQCAYPDGVCATNYPGGLCTAACTGTCPTDASDTEAFCASFTGEGGYCLPVCNPSAPACRSGYTCQRVAGVEDGGAAQYVCAPGT